MNIKPTDATLGARVTDVNLNQLDDEMFKAIEAARRHSRQRVGDARRRMTPPAPTTLSRESTNQ